MKLKVGTLFSGIGAPEEALKKMNIDYELIFACDNGERYLSASDDEELKKAVHQVPNNLKNNIIKDFYNSKISKPNYVKKTFFLNHKITDKNWFEDIRYMDFFEFKNNLDLLVGGSPCQSFSAIGKRGGIDDARGTLFYDFIRSIKESKPKVFIYENVLGIRTIDKGHTWKRMKELFFEQGYNFREVVLNSKYFDIPQSRNRVFVIGWLNQANINFNFSDLELTNRKIFDFLDKEVEDKYYLGQKGFEFVTNPKYKNRAQVNKNIMMCQKANQQFNWNGDFVFEENKKIDGKFFGTWEKKEGSIRKMTPNECIRLMGFSKEFKFPDDIPDVQKYRQSGNSIVVNVLVEIINRLIEGKAWD